MFKKYLEDDLNTANALSVLYELLKDNEVNEKNTYNIDIYESRFVSIM